MTDDWRQEGPEAKEIAEAQLGWDITDFATGDFARVGLLLFTGRNGTAKSLREEAAKSYAEKIMIVQEKQVTPCKFHHQKMEDIINRGGGELIVQFWNAAADDSLAASEVVVSTDGVRPMR